MLLAQDVEEMDIEVKHVIQVSANIIIHHYMYINVQYVGQSQGTYAHTWANGRCYECGATCSHTGGTHANGGVCTICNYGYQSHGQGTLQYKNITSTTHTPYYTCIYSGCTTTYDSTAEPHTVTTWTDNGDGRHTQWNLYTMWIYGYK